LGSPLAHARFPFAAGDTPLTKKATPAKKTKKAVKASPQKAGVKKSAKPKTRKAAASKARKSPAPKVAKAAPPSDLLQRIITSLEDDKAEAIVTIDLEGRSSLCDAAVIASGRSSRHVMSIAEHLARRLKEQGYGTRPVTGAAQGDWVLVDAGDIIVHVFRPEVRDYYDLEGMWNVAAPSRA
jgi:ribosome-associated protein